MDISIIIPIYNERNFIEKCMGTILSQNFGGLDWEVIISDGGSTDGTIEMLNKMCKSTNNIKIINNPRKFQVYALNDMINLAQGEVIIRCDAHALYSEGYFFKLYSRLKEDENIGNVGGHVYTCPADDSLMANAIALGLSSKAGVGSSHRNLFSKTDLEVDTVLFGAWRASTFKEVGLFDTDFVRGQDVEHNVRILKSGMRVIQTPEVSLNYYARNSLLKLFNMMKQYASVKPFLFKKHGIIPTIRSVVPLSFYFGLILSLLISPYLFFSLVSVYLLFLMVYSIKDAKRTEQPNLKLVMLLPLVYITQHVGHAFGFIIGIFSALFSSGLKWSATR